MRDGSLMDAVMELEIEPGPEPGSYVVHVLRSVGGGEPSETITLDLDRLLDRRTLVQASVLASSVATRRIMSETEAAVQDVGVRLFESTFTGGIRTAYRASAAVAAERDTGVRIVLRLDAPGLAALPWESLFDPETQTYLCRKEPLVRHVSAPYSPAALAISPPLRVLGMISSPRGLPTLDVEAERARLEEALRPHIDSGRVELHWLEDVSWAGVHDKLLQEEWHVLHFIGHGAYDTDTDEGVLAFVGRDGRADYVTASSLADLLDEAEPTPRLVVLNSCESGAAGTTDLFSGTAAALTHSGIHAVAAMQFSISDVAALEFARAFYSALASGRRIDEAVRSGRIGILGIGRGTLEWVTPVLYLRGDDTRLFELARGSGAGAAGAAPAAAVSEPSRASTRARARRQRAGSTDVAPAAASSAGSAVSASAGTPATPGSGPASGAPGTRAASTRPSRRRLWLVAGAIAAVVAGGAVTAVAITAFDLFAADTGGPGGEAGTGAGDGGSSPVDVTVPADVSWTKTGVFCAANGTINIKASGQATFDETEAPVGPDGLTSGELFESRVYRDADTASLIGWLDTHPERFFVGYAARYECPVDGFLLLGINDNDLGDNQGEFWAAITYTPPPQ